MFPKGHRIRFAVNNSQWPMLWPTPYAPMTTRMVLGGADGSRFELPIASASRRAPPKFLEPAQDPPPLPGFASLDSGSTSGYGEISSVNRNPQTGEVTVLATNTGAEQYPWGTEKYRETIEHRTSDAHPDKTSVVGTHRIETTLKDRVLFGSDNPVILPDRWIAEFDKLPIKPEVRSLILKENAAKLLGLK